MKRLIEAMSVLFMIYVVGTILWVAFMILKLSGKIKVVYPNNFKGLVSRTIVVYNHPDAADCQLEVFLVPILFLSQFHRHPFKFAPYFTLDQHNFTDKWYWFWLRPRAISLNRRENDRNTAQVRKMISVLKKMTGWIIHAPEAGRTRNGTEFLFSRDGKRMRKPIDSSGKPSDSLGKLVRIVKARVRPVWIETGEPDKKPTKKLFSWPRFGKNLIVIRVGETMTWLDLRRMDAPGITNTVISRMLKLADEE